MCRNTKCRPKLIKSLFSPRGERPVANQTEVIYSVFVNGRPVLAVTAANDMKLVSDSEVSAVMGKEIFMKAERKWFKRKFCISLV